MTILKGYKTYVLGAVTVISAIASWAVGDVSAADAVQLAVTALLAMTLRNGLPR